MDIKLSGIQEKINQAQSPLPLFTCLHVKPDVSELMFAGECSVCTSVVRRVMAALWRYVASVLYQDSGSYSLVGTATLRLVTVGQRSAGPSLNQGVGGSIPALVDVSLSKTLDPELLPVAALRCVNVTGL